MPVLGVPSSFLMINTEEKLFRCCLDRDYVKPSLDAGEFKLSSDMAPAAYNQGALVERCSKDPGLANDE
jgi:hypothetical protein